MTEREATTPLWNYTRYEFLQITKATAPRVLAQVRIDVDRTDEIYIIKVL